MQQYYSLGFDRIKRILTLKNSLPDLSLTNLNDVACTENEIAILDHANKTLYGYDIQTGELIYQTLVHPTLIKFSFNEALNIVGITSDSLLLVIDRFTGSIIQRFSLTLYGAFTGLELDQSCITCFNGNYAYFSNKDANLYRFSFLNNSLTLIKSEFLPSEFYSGYNVGTFKHSTNEIVIMLDRPNDKKIYFFDPETGQGTSVLTLDPTITNFPVKEICYRNNCLIIVPADTGEAYFFDAEFKEEIFGVEFSDKRINLNGTNRLKVRSLTTNPAGKNVSLGKNVFFKGITPKRLLDYLTKNFGNQTVVTNIQASTTNTLDELINHTHIKNEQFNTSGMSGRIYTLQDPNLLQNTSELYESGLYKTRFGHNSTISLVVQDYQEVVTSTTDQIKLNYDPAPNTPYTASYLVVDEFSFDHTHLYEEPSATSNPNEFKLSYVPEFSSLELYRQGVLLKRGVDYTLNNDLIIFPLLDNTDNLYATYFIPGLISGYSDHIHTVNSFFINYLVQNTPLLKKNLQLLEFPLDPQSLLVFQQGVKLKLGVDYIVSGSQVQFFKELPDQTVINVSYIISANTIPNLLKPLDPTTNTYLELQPDQYILYYLGGSTQIEGIELVATITDSIADDYTGDLFGDLEVFSLSALINSTSWDEELDDWTLLQRVFVDNVSFSNKISTFIDTKKSSVIGSFVGIRNNAPLSIFIRLLKVYTEETEEIGTLSRNRETINSDGNSLVYYTNKRTAANFVKESTLQGQNHWDFIGKTKRSYLVDTLNSELGIECIAIGRPNSYAKAIQLVEIDQFYKRALTFSVYITASVSRAVGDLISGNQFVPPGNYSLTITPTYLITQPDEIAFIEQEQPKIILMNFPKGHYRKRRFSTTWVPEYPVIRLKLQLNCEKDVIGTVYFNDIQVEEGSLSEFNSIDILEKTVKGIFIH